MLTRESGFVDFNKTSDKIYNQYRALTPWPGLWTKLDNKRVKLLKIKLADTKAPVNKINFINNKVFIGCADNSSIEVLELQLEGKKPMQAEVFINGYKNFDKQQLNV